MEITNNYYRVRNSYATTVTPVSKVKPVVNEKAVTNLIATSKVNDSVSISNTGRSFINGLSEIQKQMQTEEVATQPQVEDVPSFVSPEKNYTSIEDVRAALGINQVRKIEEPIAKPVSQEPMTMRKKLALSAYQKAMSYAPTVMSGALIQSLM
ncbi:MAG: hypothetical protein IKM20_01555 [Erysipelotrichales bacterium]|nr:hypothetical protein [Erysipelotrichales bacterium]